MANDVIEIPSPDSQDEFVVRSGARSGLKREFAFALKAQSEVSSSLLGRTRSDKILAGGLPNPAKKRQKTGPDTGNPPERGPEKQEEVSDANRSSKRLEKGCDVSDKKMKTYSSKNSKLKRSGDVNDELLKSESERWPRHRGRTDLKEKRIRTSDASDLEQLKKDLTDSRDKHLKTSEGDTVDEEPERNSEETPCNGVCTESSSKELQVAEKIGRNSAEVDGVPADECNEQVKSSESEAADDSKNDLMQLNEVSEVSKQLRCSKNAATEDLKNELVDLNDVSHISEGFKSSDVLTNAVEESKSDLVKPFSNGIFASSNAELVTGPDVEVMEASDNDSVKVLSEEGSGAGTCTTSGDKVELIQNCSSKKEKPQLPPRRFTRSALKVQMEPVEILDLTTGNGAKDAEGNAVLPDASQKETTLEDVVEVTDVVGPLRSATPQKKMELKMSKKIGLNKFPTNTKELLATGLLEGLPVKYIYHRNRKTGLKGTIKDCGILCCCADCKGSKVVTALKFEQHAGSLNKRAPEYIYLENGNTIRDVLIACKNAPVDMLEATIQSAVGSLPPTKSTVCQSCGGLLYPSKIGRSKLLCKTCLESKQSQASPVHGDSARSSKPHSVQKSTNETSKHLLLQKKSEAKITRKDLGLHKLAFTEDILPDGTEVAYFVQGQKLLQGYKKGLGIFCSCCNSVVSPSQFEAHAGWASRRKPYMHIYTSNGVSLHELAISLSKGRKLSATDNDDLCTICADGGNLMLCDGCPRSFHKECLELSTIPSGKWYCRYCQNVFQKDKFVEHNANALAAGRVLGVDPIEQITKRCIRIVKDPEATLDGCVLCRCRDFSKSGFGPRTVLLCDQCEKEFHVGCLKEHKMANLKELPEGKWFCCADCCRIHTALQKLLHRGPEKLPSSLSDVIKTKHDEKSSASEGDLDVRWQLLSGKHDSSDSKLLLSKAVTIFHECFDPIVDSTTGRDLIPSMVYGRNMRNQELGGMYCAVLTVNSSVVSAGLLRVFGREVAELPLVATRKENQGRGYFQSLFSCIERLLGFLNVKNLVLPAADEAESIWTKRFGFKKMDLDQLCQYRKDSQMMTFQGTSILHKLVPKCRILRKSTESS